VLSFLALGLMSLAAAISSGMKTTAVSRDTASATHAARQVLEQLQDQDRIAFEEIFAAHNANPDDDPAGLDPVPGPAFPVEGLRRADPAEAVGEIIFPTGGIDGTELREDVAGFDLNGDAKLDTRDHAADYKLLPVTIRVQWTGITGPRTLEFQTILSRR
jgi:hypothetical protein